MRKRRKQRDETRTVTASIAYTIYQELKKAEKMLAKATANALAVFSSGPTAVTQKQRRKRKGTSIVMAASTKRPRQKKRRRGRPKLSV